MAPSNKSFNSLLLQARGDGFTGENPTRAELLEFLGDKVTTAPAPEVKEKKAKVEIKKDDAAEDEKVAEVEASDSKEKKNRAPKTEVTDRRTTVESLVRERFNTIGKPIGHTAMFKEIFPDEPEGKSAVQKWNDIGRVITVMVNAGELIAEKAEGKRRTTFSLVNTAAAE